MALHPIAVRQATDETGDVLTVTRFRGGRVLVAINDSDGDTFMTAYLTPEQWAEVISL